MRKPLWSLLMIIATLLCTAGMLAWQPADNAVEAHLVTVERADVHQVLAIEGRVGYAQQQYIFSTSSGIVTQVCVEKGQRVASGQALIRLEGPAQAQLASVLAANALPTSAITELLPASQSVIRAKDNCTVREVLVEEDAPVVAGTPVAAVSSNQQEIISYVSVTDSEKLSHGMWGWISSGGSPLGTAFVAAIGECQADALTGMPCVQITFRPEAHIDLPAGAAVDLDVFLYGSDGVPSLPREAITERDTVWWVNDGRCTEIPAGIIMADEIRAWVDLPEGMMVAVGEFSEGMRIREAAE